MNQTRSSRLPPLLGLLSIAAVAACGRDRVPPATEPTTTSALVPREGTGAAVPSRISFQSRLPDSYELEGVRVLVDGSVAYAGRLPPRDVQVPPGEHAVEVVADYRLHDPVLTYVSAYRVELHSRRIVPVVHGPVSFVVTALPTGGVTTPMDRQAALAWTSASGP